MVSASASPGSLSSPTQATYPSGRINTAVGAATAPSAGSSHGTGVFGVDQLNPIRPWGDVEAARLAEVEQHRPGIVQQLEDPQWAVGGDQVEIGHAASEQRVSLAEVVMDVQAEHHRGEAVASLVRAEQLGNGLAQGLRAFVLAAERDVRHRGAQHAGGDRVTLGVVGVQEAFRRCPVDHLGQLPAQIHRILHAGVEALPTVRGMHVCGVAGQQDPSLAVGRGLPGHVGEPGDRGGTVDPVIGPVDGDQPLAEIAQGGFGRGSDVLFGQHDPYRPAVRVDNLAVADLVLHPADAMGAERVLADAQFRLLGHLDLGDQVARRRIPPGELDAGCLADQAASSVAPGEILRPQRLAVGQLDVDAGFVLREPRHLTPAIDRHLELFDPAGQDALDVLLPEPERVGMPGGKVADVQSGAGELPELGHLSLREEPIGDSTLIHDLDAARVQTTCARAGEVLAGPPLDNRNVHARQRQLARQHQPRRTASGDHHRMPGLLIHFAPPIPSPSRSAGVYTAPTGAS